MKILQANMHRSKTADALLPQLITEHDADVVVISEQYGTKSSGIWLEDATQTAAIWLPGGSKFIATGSGAGTGFVWAYSLHFTLMSCYLTPSDNIEEFQSKLNSIEDKILEIGGSFLIAGDFNSKAVEWGMPLTNSRGRRVLDMSARLGLILVNTGTATTFRRAGCQGTIPDITLASEGIAHMMTKWKVLEDYTGSDHQYISYHVGTASSINRGDIRAGTRKWNVLKLNPEALLAEIDTKPLPRAEKGNATTMVKLTMHNIARACDKAMPTSGSCRRKKPVYWWTEEIARLRCICLRRRRKQTRARRTGPAVVETEEYKTAKKELKLAIHTSKRRKWEELRSDINNDPWGLGYKIVMRKFGVKPAMPELEADKMDSIVNALFPTHDIRTDDMEATGEDTIPLFTEDELKTAASTLKNNKAPGPDGVPAEVIKVTANERPQVLLHIYNACLTEGIFPELWKRQRLVLISKGKGNPESPSAYRPLCMLDTAGKLLERLIKPRLIAAINNTGGLSKRQHGFIPGRCTIGAIEEVVTSVEAAQRGNHYSRRVVLLATLDVRNAFNSVRWTDMIEALENRFRVPTYLKRIIRSYLRDRELIYDTADGTRIKQITSGAAQGSILGPDLWNVSYDEILHIEMPDDTYLVGYADDIAAVITARDTEEAQRKLNQVMLRTQAWLDSHGLKLATEKTELLLLTKKHIPLEVEMRICVNTISTQKVVNYLGIRLDNKLSYWAQIKYAAIKAAQATASLSRLMANVGGPVHCKRKLLMSTTQSILLYGCELWADALKAEYRRKVLSSVQRTAALRVASAYRTVSEVAVLVISGTTPIDLLAYERKKIWVLKKMNKNMKTTAQETKLDTLRQWQERWNTNTRGRWTAKLIPDLDTWLNRGFGEVNYYLTQFLSGHGYFRKYLCTVGKVETPQCIYGDSELDDAEHTFFQCTRWKSKRADLQNLVGHIAVDNVVKTMLNNEQNWCYVAKYVEDILRKKKRDLDAGITIRVH